jgi:ribulose 1,5-bisphosphate synthetase/thiazole synthase
MQRLLEQAPPDRQIRGSETTETEVVVIGSGIGGLSCGALLAKYGVKVWQAVLVGRKRSHHC